MSESLPGAEDIVAEHWPLHGPYSPARAETAAATVAELVRYLNYATGHGAGDALRYASQVYRLVGALRTAAGGLEQTLHQLARRTQELAGDPTLGHCQHRSDRQAAQIEATAATEALTAARRPVCALYEALNAAQSHLRPLEHREEA